MKLFRLRRSFSLNAVFIYIALFCVSTYALLEHTSIPISAFSSVKLPLMYVGFFCLVTQIRTIFRCLLKKHYFYMLLTLALFCVLLIVSMFANRNTLLGVSPLRHTVRLLLFLVELFLLMIVLAETGRGDSTLKFLFWYVLLITLINDGMLLSRVITFGSGKYENYLVGTKFSVSYIHMNLLTLWVIRGKWNGRGKWWGKLLILAMAAYIVILSIRVNCMTGIIGCLALVILNTLLNSPKRNRLLRLTSSKVLLIVLLLSVFFAFIADSIVHIPFVEYVVEDVLGRDTTITGRINIYEMYVNNMKDHWLSGFGYGNGNEAAVTLFGYENVQNALLQWTLQVGIPASLGLVAVMYQVFNQINRKNSKNMDKILPLVSLIYTYIFLGTVETTFNMAFILWLALIFMLVNEKKRVSIQRMAMPSSAENGETSV